MDVGRQQVPKGVVNETVLGEATQVTEAGTGDPDVEMTTTVARAGVPSVQMTLVRNFEQVRLKVCGEAVADCRDPVSRTVDRHGMTWTNGLTITSVQTPAMM